MPNTIEVASLIWNDLTKSDVPATVDEYNALDPKRPNAVVEDAVDERMKHSVLGTFRSAILDVLCAVEPKVERINHGDEENPNWESDGKLMKRLLVIRITASGGNPSDPTAIAAFAASTKAQAQAALDAIKFTVARAERTGMPVAKIGKADLALGEQAVNEGKAEKFAQLLGAKLNRVVEATALGIATALKDKRKADADAQALANAAELASLG